jgi:hypothetical protein
MTFPSATATAGKELGIFIEVQRFWQP